MTAPTAPALEACAPPWARPPTRRPSPISTEARRAGRARHTPPGHPAPHRLGARARRGHQREPPGHVAIGLTWPGPAARRGRLGWSPGMADPMRDESVRAWQADHRKIATLDGNVTTGTVTPSEDRLPDCGQGLAVRFDSSGCLVRSLSRTRNGPKALRTTGRVRGREPMRGDRRGTRAIRSGRGTSRLRCPLAERCRTTRGAAPIRASGSWTFMSEGKDPDSSHQGSEALSDAGDRLAYSTSGTWARSGASSCSLASRRSATRTHPPRVMTRRVRPCRRCGMQARPPTSASVPRLNLVDGSREA